MVVLYIFQCTHICFLPTQCIFLSAFMHKIIVSSRLSYVCFFFQKVSTSPNPEKMYCILIRKRPYLGMYALVRHEIALFLELLTNLFKITILLCSFNCDFALLSTTLSGLNKAPSEKCHVWVIRV